MIRTTPPATQPPTRPALLLPPCVPGVAAESTGSCADADGLEDVVAELEAVLVDWDWVGWEDEGDGVAPAVPMVVDAAFLEVDTLLNGLVLVVADGVLLELCEAVVTLSTVSVSVDTPLVGSEHPLSQGSTEQQPIKPVFEQT
jgi:hypothetical protein